MFYWMGTSHVATLQRIQDNIQRKKLRTNLHDRKCFAFSLLDALRPSSVPPPLSFIAALSPLMAPLPLPYPTLTSANTSATLLLSRAAAPPRTTPSPFPPAPNTRKQRCFATPLSPKISTPSLTGVGPMKCTREYSSSRRLWRSWKEF